MLEKILNIPFKVLLKILKSHPKSLSWTMKKVLKLHSFSYHLAGELAILHEGGIHPKHKILLYKEWFVDQIEVQDIVFDIGCNTGLLADKLSEKAKHVYGIEIEESLVAKAKKTINKDNIDFICADATSYDFSQYAVHCITLSNVLEHIEYRVTFLKKLINNIPWKDMSNRRIYIRVPLIEREWPAVYKKQVGLDYRLDPTHFTEYTVKEFYEEMSASGIEVVSHEIRFGEIFTLCKVIN
ncbi:MAG: class I SAM-dependent methyltransferase [Candidatus Cloacimonetes bacterium]|nr:class I SAM-dependent methyltransferase [Candidatus Cloacimonadota bacterium]